MTKMDMTDPGCWDLLIASYEEHAHPFTAHFARAALEGLEIGPATRVIDIGTGMGAAALAAAERGAEVLAIDFSAGMIDRVRSHGLPNLEARRMDGQALKLPDAAFDLSLSMFGVTLFPDWRRGLREMARVTRPGGIGVVATWQQPGGAASHLLLSEVRAALFPELDRPALPDGMELMRDPERFAAELVAAGFEAPAIREVTHDFLLRLDALDAAERVFAWIPAWSTLTDGQRAAVVAEIRRRAADAGNDETLAVRSTALVATAAAGTRAAP